MKQRGPKVRDTFAFRTFVTLTPSLCDPPGVVRRQGLER
jgi:hypothetical protein